MLNITTDIQSLTTFRRSSGDFMKHLKKSKRPVEGKAKAYQRLRDSAARTDVYEAIRQGLGDTASGRTFPARKVFEELRAKHGIPR